MYCEACEAIAAHPYFPCPGATRYFCGIPIDCIGRCKLLWNRLAATKWLPRACVIPVNVKLFAQVKSGEVAGIRLPFDVVVLAVRPSPKPNKVSSCTQSSPLSSTRDLASTVHTTLDSPKPAEASGRSLPSQGGEGEDQAREGKILRAPSYVRYNWEGWWESGRQQQPELKHRRVAAPHCSFLAWVSERLRRTPARCPKGHIRQAR